MKKEIQFDFKKISKEYKKLKCPADVYNPCTIPYNLCKWAVVLSDRSRGKTTNLLLYGLVLNKLYGTVIQYIRCHENDIVKKNSQNLFDTIIHYDYIPKLTNGEYNTILYDRRRWYYGYIDENGDIIKKSSTHICMMLSVDKNQTYKSVYNAPLGDYIIFDEFIEKYYYPNDFINFVDLVKTIARDRTTPLITLCANTIDRNSPYFNELEVYKDISTMRMGDNRIVTTDLGTKIYIEILGAVSGELSSIRSKVNKLYYGFKNSKLASVTGVDTWAMDIYPHPPKDYKVLSNNHYLIYSDKLYQIEICMKDNLIFAVVHDGKETHDDSIIYTLGEVKDIRYRYKKGVSKLDKFIWELYDTNQFTYVNNSVGDVIKKYVTTCKSLARI